MAKKGKKRVNDYFGFTGIDEDRIRQEKARARKLRKSQWWNNLIAAGKCHYCHRSFPPAELTMDHIVPLARGGASTKGNLAPACKECNTKKKTLLPYEWDEYMAQLAGME